MKFKKLKIAVLIAFAISILIFANIIFFGLLQGNQNLNVPVNNNKSLSLTNNSPQNNSYVQPSDSQTTAPSQGTVINHPMMNTRAS